MKYYIEAIAAYAEISVLATPYYNWEAPGRILRVHVADYCTMKQFFPEGRRIRFSCEDFSLAVISDECCPEKLNVYELKELTADSE